MYVHRRNLDTEEYRVYLAPLGPGDLKNGFLQIIENAASWGKKVRFYTLTERYANALGELFPGRFEIAHDRNLAEYMYRTEIMAAFPGHALYKRRQEVNAFWNRYADRAKVTRIVPEDLPEIHSF